MNASNKMHRNKLPGTLIFQNFLGEHPIPLCRRGALLQHIIPQDRRYRDEIVLRLLYNFLLLHFFNLKTLQQTISCVPHPKRQLFDFPMFYSFNEEGS